jgi:hypothetical protein
VDLRYGDDVDADLDRENRGGNADDGEAMGEKKADDGPGSADEVVAMMPLM